MRHLRVTLAVGVAVAGALAACSSSTGRPSTPTVAATTLPPPTTAASTAAPTTAAPTTTVAGAAVVAENQRPGTTAWRIDADDPLGWIDAYADTTSAAVGDTVTLFADTDSASWAVEAYRMGWYGGAQGRLVWRSPEQPGRRQPAPVIDPTTKLTEARWAPSLQVEVDERWVPGAYLLKLVTSGGGAHYVPLTVRDDAASAALAVVTGVTTWQAYNPWGSCSLYACFSVKAPRATVVSFDRPYAHTYAKGAANFLDQELPLVSFAEQLGLDVTYLTDVDLHRDPARLLRHRAVITLGHDEYYSTPMRRALEQARAAGVNLAFLGANAVYRHIRLEPSWDGRSERRQVNYRSTRDPGARLDPLQATVEWRNPPLSQPEAELVGIQYACAPMRGDLRLVATDSWVYEGTGAVDGQVLPDLVASEYDRVAPSSPAGLELLAHSPVRCGGRADHHHTSWYSHPSGAGVFATGTNHWICNLDGTCPNDEATRGIVRGVTANVLRAMAAGPAGTAHPSRPNVEDVLGG